MPSEQVAPKKPRERWTPEEHELFLEGLKKYHRDWRAVERAPLLARPQNRSRSPSEHTLLSRRSTSAGVQVISAPRLRYKFAAMRRNFSPRRKKSRALWTLNCRRRGQSASLAPRRLPPPRPRGLPPACRWACCSPASLMCTQAARLTPSSPACCRIHRAPSTRQLPCPRAPPATRCRST